MIELIAIGALVGGMIGFAIGLMVSGYPIEARMQYSRTKLMEAEQIYYEWCLIRAGKMEAEYDDEKTIARLSDNQFAQKCYWLFNDAGYPFRGQRIRCEIIEKFSRFELEYTNENRPNEAKVKYN